MSQSFGQISGLSMAEYKQTRGAWSHESGGEDHRVSVGGEEAPQGQSPGVLQS